MATWKVDTVSTRDELDVIAELLLDKADDSRNLFFPVHNGDRAAALRDVRQRLWDEHTGDPASHWIYIRDPTVSTAGAIVGVCQWRIYTSNPFEAGVPELDATWWPRGGDGREFTNVFMRQIFVPRATCMARPHSGMSWIVVVPEHRRRGIGTALMEWGMRRTDELGLESYIEGTVLGAHLYKSCGYVRVNRIDFDMARDDVGDEYKQLEARLKRKELPPGFDAMWRPVGGVLEEDEPERTWDERLKKLQA